MQMLLINGDNIVLNSTSFLYVIFFSPQIGEIDTVFNDFSDILGNLESVAADVTQYG